MSAIVSEWEHGERGLCKTVQTTLAGGKEGVGWKMGNKEKECVN